MKPEELRIGNLAQDQNGNILEVRGIKVGNIHYYVIDRSKYPLNEGWQAEPIPLTEEWLLKFGFECEEDIFFKLPFPENISWCRDFAFILFNGVFGGVEIITYHDKSKQKVFHEHTVYIKHVHQLQNLYYALTGEELEIKK